MFERSRTLAGHIKSRHQDEIFVDESGNYELNNIAFNEIFAKNRDIYNHFLKLAQFLQNHNGDENNEHKALFERLQNHCNGFLENFATKADVEALRLDVDAIKNSYVEQGQNITDMRHSLQETQKNVATLAEEFKELKDAVHSNKQHDSITTANHPIPKKLNFAQYRFGVNESNLSKLDASYSQKAERIENITREQIIKAGSKFARDLVVSLFDNKLKVRRDDDINSDSEDNNRIEVLGIPKVSDGVTIFEAVKLKCCISTYQHKTKAGVDIEIVGAEKGK